MSSNDGIEDRILLSRLTQTVPAGWSSVGWRCIALEKWTDGSVRARIWVRADPLPGTQNDG